jgi:hypothetical protein
MGKKYYRKPISEEEKKQLEEIGNLVYQFRQDTFLSRKDFCELHDIPKSVLENIETGGNYHVVSILRVATVLGIDLHSLLYDL